MNSIISKIINNIASTAESKSLQNIVEALKEDYNIDMRYQIVLDILGSHGHLNEKYYIKIKNEEIIPKEKLIGVLHKEIKMFLKPRMHLEMKDLLLSFESTFHFKYPEDKFILIKNKIEDSLKSSAKTKCETKREIIDKPILITSDTLIETMLDCLEEDEDERYKHLSPFGSKFSFRYDFTIDDILMLLYTNCCSSYIYQKVQQYRNSRFICKKLKRETIDDPHLENALSKSLVNECKNIYYDLYTIENLIAKGADPSYNNSEALKYCCKYNKYIEVVKLLLQYGADIKGSNYEALNNASNEGFYILETLMKYIK